MMIAEIDWGISVVGSQGLCRASQVDIVFFVEFL